MDTDKDDHKQEHDDEGKGRCQMLLVLLRFVLSHIYRHRS